MTLFTPADIEAQRVIDTEILRYQGLIRALCARRNAYNAMLKLPNEITSRILVEFKVIVDAELQRNDGRDPKAYLIKLLTVTRVCSWWRQIALDTAAFWATLPLDGLSWVAEAFTRSKQSPLTVVGSLGKLCTRKAPRHIFDAIMDAAPRFSDVNINLITADMYYTPIPASLFSADVDLASRPEVPFLRTLKINYEAWDGEYDYYDREKERERPDGVDNSDSGISDEYDDDDGSERSHRYIYDSDYDYSPRTMPFPWTTLNSLQSLALKNIVPVLLPPAPALTYLNIQINHWDDKPYLSVPRVLDVLRNTPVVESATISTVFSDATSVVKLPESTAAMIHLPNLKELNVTSKSLKESVLFAYLDTPALRKTMISYNNDSDDPGIQPNGGDTSHLRHLIAQGIPSNVDGLKVVMKMATPTTSMPRRHDGNGYQLIVQEEKETDYRNSILEVDVNVFPLAARSVEIGQCLPLGRIMDLTLERVGGGEEALAWSRVIPQLVRLRRLTVNKFKILSMLLPVPEPDTGLSSSLSSLDIVNVPSSIEVYNPDLQTISMEDVPLSSSDLQSLKSMAAFRHSRHKPLRNMALYNFAGAGRKKYEKEMRRFGTWVEWVNITDRESDDYDSDYHEGYGYGGYGGGYGYGSKRGYDSDDSPVYLPWWYSH
ncbi:hypothetical protein ONZ45_g7548 [Pleurotus djamor]|nr:hypothetical protein ONZ45_g7548 [Pleurotus djamor]